MGGFATLHFGLTYPLDARVGTNHARGPETASITLELA